MSDTCATLTLVPIFDQPGNRKEVAIFMNNCDCLVENYLFGSSLQCCWKTRSIGQ